MEELEKQMQAERVTEAIRELEPEPGTYEACGVEDVDKAYPMLMNDRPRQKPATCPLRRRLVKNYLEDIEQALGLQTMGSDT